MEKPDNKLCPSATCHPDAMLLGVVQGDQTVTLLPEPIKITQEFIDIATANGEPEKNFRFAGKCAKGGCNQWTGTSCGVMDRLSAINEKLEAEIAGLPECSIRSQCRWFSQEGKKACIICPYVVTNMQD